MSRRNFLAAKARRRFKFADHCMAATF